MYYLSSLKMRSDFLIERLCRIRLLDKTIRGFAYPNGDYGQREIDFVKRAGYEYAVTVEHGQVTEKSDDYKLPRICLNDFGSVSENLVKASGIWNYIKF